MFPENFTEQVDTTFLFVFIVSLVFLVGITVSMIFFLIKYHHSKNKPAKDIHGHLGLELTWTLIPTVLVMAMFYYGMVGYRKMDRIPENALKVETTGRMWSWAFTYENGAQSDTLYVPVNKPVRLNLNSQDVIHSFYIPAFRIKRDVVPGVHNSMWFTAEESGNFQVFCAEYCGLRHSYMLTEVKAMPGEEFDSWYRKAGEALVASKPAATGEQPQKKGSRGLQIMQIKGCLACHTTDGTPAVGPTYKSLYGRQEVVIENGQENVITVDETYLKRSILNPEAQKVKGYENIPMPPQQLTDEELEEIIAYLKELK